MIYLLVLLDVRHVKSSQNVFGFQLGDGFPRTRRQNYHLLLADDAVFKTIFGAARRDKYALSHKMSHVFKFTSLAMQFAGTES